MLVVPGIRGRLVPKYKQQRQCVGSFHEFQEQLTRSQSKPINHNLNPYSKFTTAEILDLYLEDPIATLLDLLALRCALVLRWIGFWSGPRPSKGAMASFTYSWDLCTFLIFYQETLAQSHVITHWHLQANIVKLIAGKFRIKLGIMIIANTQSNTLQTKIR